MSLRFPQHVGIGVVSGATGSMACKRGVLQIRHVYLKWVGFSFILDSNFRDSMGTTGAGISLLAMGLA